MKIGGKIKLYIFNDRKDFTCIAESKDEDSDETDFIFVCDDDPSIVRKLPEWLADLC